MKTPQTLLCVWLVYSKLGHSFNNQESELFSLPYPVLWDGNVLSLAFVLSCSVGGRLGFLSPPIHSFPYPLLKGNAEASFSYYPGRQTPIHWPQELEGLLTHPGVWEAEETAGIEAMAEGFSFSLCLLFLEL